MADSKMSLFSVDEMLEDKRILCVISTPFQLFSLLALRANGFLGNSRPTVLLHGALAEDKELLKRLDRSGYFDAVHVAQGTYPTYRHLGMTCLRDFLLQSRAIKKSYEETFPGIKDESFDWVVASCADRPLLEAKRFSAPNGKTILIDDGEGTHIGFVLQPLACFDQAAARAVRRPGLKSRLKYAIRTAVNTVVGSRSNLNIQRVYAFNVNTNQMTQMYGDIPVTSLDAKAVPEADLRLICPSTDVDAYRNAHYIYLTFPGDMPFPVLEREMQIVEEMEERTAGKIWIRLHPRRCASDFSRYSDRVLGEAFWEALVLNSVVDSSKCLIGAGSTAQSSPFSLCAAEPQCIYLFQLFNGVVADLSPFNDSAENLRRSYGNHAKVCIPQSDEELLALLK